MRKIPEHTCRRGWSVCTFNRRGRHLDCYVSPGKHQLRSSRVCYVVSSIPGPIVLYYADGEDLTLPPGSWAVCNELLRFPTHVRIP